MVTDNIIEVVVFVLVVYFALLFGSLGIYCLFEYIKRKVVKK